jgi:mycothiol synthase
MRPYRTEDDYWRIRGFLREVFLLNGRREVSWQAARFDYWRWHGIENMGDGRLERDVFIWETADGHITAVLNRESAGEAYLQAHPGRRTPKLEQEMIAVAEEHLAVPTPGGGSRLRIWANQHDRLRHEILIRRGYARGDRTSTTREGLASGIASSSACRSIAATWTSWRLPPAARSPRSARCGTTT